MRYNVVVNTKGTFNFGAPFDTVLEKGSILTIVGENTIDELIAEGIDVFATIYKLSGLSEEDMNNDREENVTIVKFLLDSGKRMYVPNDRILSMPKYTGDIYQEKVLAFNIGAVPEILDLAPLLSDIEELIKSRIGSEATSKIVEASAKILIEDPVEIDRINSIRLQKINEPLNYRTQLEKANAANKHLLEEVKWLKECVNL